MALLDAEFSRIGPNLVVTDPSGDQAVVRDYFAHESAQRLAVDGGVEMSGDLVSRLAGPAAPTLVAQAAPTVGGEPIGSVDSVDGVVTATRADGTQVVLQPGDPVYQGDVLESSADSAIGVILADATVFSMGPDSRMVLDEMVFDPGVGEGSLAISAIKGVFTVVSGQIAKADPEAMVVDTPLASIGIRGTQAGISIADGGDLLVVLMQEANGFVGEIVVSAGGTALVINQLHFATLVDAATALAAEPFQLTEPQVVDTFNTVLGRLPIHGGAGHDYGVGDRASPDELPEFGIASGPDDVPGQFTITYGDVDAETLAALTELPDLFAVPTAESQQDGNDPSPVARDDQDDDDVVALAEGAEEVAGLNVIVGTAGPDDLTGTAGDDKLIGLGDSDTLTGGAGNDIFSYTLDEIRAEGGDTITDFVAGEDKIEFLTTLFGVGPAISITTQITTHTGTKTNAVFSGNFTAITLTGTNTIDKFDPPDVGNPVFVYDNRDDVLYYTDDDGASYTTVAEFTNDPSLTAADIQIAAA